MRFTGIIVCLALLPVSVFSSEIHKWRDDNGQLHFGDRPPVHVQSERVSVRPNTYTSVEVQALNRADMDSDESSPKPKSKQVVMYSTEWCGVCKKARNYFQANDIPFKEYDVEKTKKGAREYKKLNATGVPVILVDKQRMNGFSSGAFDQLYKSARR